MNFRKKYETDRKYRESEGRVWNMTVRELLLLHANRYPSSEPTDFLKLVYQAAYGPGHLVCDASLAAARIAEEMADAPALSELLEPIGGGYARLFLGTARERGISPEEIAERVLRAASQAPDPARFDAMLAELLLMASEGLLAFSESALFGALSDWEAAGRPLFRHSALYRETYLPAYRIVMEESCS